MTRRWLVAVFLAAVLMSARSFSGVRASLMERAKHLAQAQTNPYEGRPEAIQAGAKLYVRHCAACHGENAGGIGKAPPLASSEVREAQPGALFWILRNGSRATGMPSFSWLPAPQRWQIIAWLRQTK